VLDVPGSGGVADQGVPVKERDADRLAVFGRAGVGAPGNEVRAMPGLSIGASQQTFAPFILEVSCRLHTVFAGRVLCKLLFYALVAARFAVS
jgi:hypothetical protein